MNEIELLKRMVEIYSPTGEEEKLAKFLVQTMSEMGFDASVDEAGNAIGCIGDSGPTILLAGQDLCLEM